MLWGALGKCSNQAGHRSPALANPPMAHTRLCACPLLSAAHRDGHGKLFHHAGHAPSIPFNPRTGAGVISNCSCQPALMRSFGLWLM